METKVKYVDWGIANVYKDGTIEMHKDLQLPEYKALHDKILDHEKDHDFKKGFMYNLQVDVLHSVGTFGLLNFMMTRPKTWVQILPLYWTKKDGIVYDKNLIVFWSIILIAIVMIIKLTTGGT